MSSRVAPPANRLSILAALAAAAACSGTDADSLRVRRLPLGDVRYREIRSVSRPAFTLRTGESRACVAEARPGSRLEFAWGVLRRAPRRGSVELRVTAGPRTLYSRRVPARHAAGGGWIRAQVALDPVGPVRLEFRAVHLGERGGELPSRPDDPEWIAVATPRLYVPVRQARRRVLIWISQDALRADHVGAYGYSRETTPAFDRRSRDWILFERAVATASWTLPSMASQFTSWLPTRHGAVRPDLKVDPAATSLFEVLSAEGFTVLGVTGNGFVSRHFGMADGFDAVWTTKGGSEANNRRALQALEEWPGGDLALFVHYMDPHADYAPPPPFDTLFDPDYRGEVDGVEFQHLRPTSDPADVEHVRALYDGEIAHNDGRIEALLRVLESRGILEDAVIAYTSDHGEEFLDHGRWTHAFTLYEEMLHVPLALHLPGVPGRRVAPVVSLLDLAPTLLSALGVEVPASFEGRSLLPALREGAAIEPAPALAETEYGKRALHRVALRDGGTKYEMSTPRSRGLDAEVLSESIHDLDVDPEERTPLPMSAKHEPLRRHVLLYLKHARAVAGGSRADVPPELAQELRALGYIE